MAKGVRSGWETMGQRFLKKLKPAPSGCIEWQGSKDGKGYGTISCRRALPPQKAHRVAFQLSVGPIPAGLHVLHKCDNPACVNPDHLFLGTHRDNMDDMIAKGRDRKVGSPGEAHGRALLSWEDVRSIRELYSTGEWLYRDLAEKFSVGYGTIEKVVRNEYWVDGSYKYCGIGNKKPRPWRRKGPELAEILPLREKGLTYKQIGEVFGVSKTTIRNYLKEGVDG